MESVNIIPDCKRRLKDAYTDLQALLVRQHFICYCACDVIIDVIQDNADGLDTTDEYIAAKSQLDDLTGTL